MDKEESGRTQRGVEGEIKCLRERYRERSDKKYKRERE